jgi:glycosyltransferase involved in cell wall biosynthesis
MTGSECMIVVPEVSAFGGAERSVLALSRWLHQHAIAHRFVSYYDRIGLANYADHPVKLTELNPPGRAVQKILSLRRFFGALPPGSPRPLMSGFQAALHASLAGLKGYHTLMHDTPSLFSDGGKAETMKGRLRGKFADWMVGKGLRSGGKTIVTSEYLKSDSDQLYRSDAVIIRMGGMASGADFRPRMVEATLRMLSVSRVEANKRIDWMLRALAALERKAPKLSEAVDWRLDVVGGGSLIEPLQALTRELGIADRVQFHGFLSDARLEELFDQAGLFLMPSRQGYGIPAVEALHRGIPVMLHRESGVSDILLDTPWCTVMHGNEDTMASSLDNAIRSLLERRHIGVKLPPIPTEAAWAESVVRSCGWIY